MENSFQKNKQGEQQGRPEFQQNNQRPVQNQMQRPQNLQDNKMKQDVPQKNTESKKIATKNPVQAGWDNFTQFIKEAFIKTPFETVFELLLLVAGATRTLDLMRSMGQSAYTAIIGLIYAELGIVLYEFLMYRGKRVKKEKISKDGTVYKVYPFFNQKSLAKIGLWLVHIPLTVIFTTSDLIMTNLKTMTGSSADFSYQFAWILGLVIGFGFFLDLILVINYKAKDPEKEHAEAMSQLQFDKRAWELEREEIEAEESLIYAKQNAKPLAQTRAKLQSRASILNEFGDTLGREYVDGLLEEVNLGAPKNKNENENENGRQGNQRPRPQQPERLPQTPVSNNDKGNIASRHPDEELVKEEKNTPDVGKEDRKNDGENFPRPRPQQP